MARGAGRSPLPGRSPLLRLACAALILLATDGAFAQEEPEGAPLLFLGNKNIAPVVYLENGVPVGVAVDIARAIAKRIPRPVEIRAMDWAEAQAMVAQGKADALIQINQTEARKKIYDFSEPLLESHFSIFTRADMVARMSGLESLRGLRVGVEAGGLPYQQLKDDPGVLLVVIPNFLEGFTQLSSGSLDAVVVDYRVGSFFIATNRIAGIVATGAPISSSYSAFAVKKGNAQLLGEIDGALRAIRADGSYQRIIDSWKPKEVVFETLEQIAQEANRTAIIVLGILLLVALGWSITLSRTLSRRKATEKRLREQYSTLRGIINSVSAPVYSVDRHYRYTSFNRAHADIMKDLYGAEILLGRSILEFISVAEDRDVAKKLLDRALADKSFAEETYSGEDQQTRQYYLISHDPIKDEGGKVIGVAVFAHDITERRRVEKSLDRMNRELRAISDCNQILVRAKDEQKLLNDTCRVICERAGYRMAWVGYPENDAARTIRIVARAGNDEGYLDEAKLTWADVERGRGPSGTAIRTGEVSLIQDFASDPAAAPWREAALKRGYRSSSSLPLKDEHEAVFGVLNIYSAEPRSFIPEEIRLLQELADDLAFGIRVLRARVVREQAEAELRQVNERFALAADAAHLGVWDWDLRNDVLAWDDRMYELYGTAKGNFAGAYEAWLAGLHPDDRERCDEVSKLARRGECAYDTEFRVIWPDGSVHHLKAFGQVVRDAKGRPFRMTGVNFDISELKRAEAELQSLNKELERRVKERTAELEATNMELEKMNKLFVGRELRMKELKARLADLEGPSPKEGPNG